MSAAAALYAILAADSGVSALVATRIYPNIAPQGATLPALVYNLTSQTPEYCHDGELDTATARMQIDIYADTYAELEALSAAVHTALSDYAGTAGAIDISTIEILAVFDAGLLSPDIAKQRRIVDLMIYYN